jgi:hypothetical protein
MQPEQMSEHISSDRFADQGVQQIDPANLIVYHQGTIVEA